MNAGKCFPCGDISHPQILNAPGRNMNPVTEIFEEVVSLLQRGESFALATVVRTRGSCPQQAGARMLVRKDGTTLGTLGGGCVEGDIWHLATEMLREKSGPRLQRYTLTEKMAARDGLVCGGTMYFFIQPLFEPGEFLSVAERILSACRGGDALAVATVIGSGDSGITVGTRQVVYGGGGPPVGDAWPWMDQQLMEAGRELAERGEVRCLKTSGGAEVFLEGFCSPPALIIMGGGHVGKAVSRLAAGLGFRIVVLDDREEYANSERFPEAQQTIVAGFEKGLSEVRIHANCYIIVATRGHRYDDLAVESALKTPARYIGLLGSKRKSLMIFQRLLAQGVPAAEITRVQAPVGLNIGAKTPDELAVSIMAEILAVQRGKDGGMMKMGAEFYRKALGK